MTPAAPAGADAELPPETLRFHAEAKGAQVLLDDASTARRLATFHDGLCSLSRSSLGRRRVKPREHMSEGQWISGGGVDTTIGRHVGIPGCLSMVPPAGLSQLLEPGPWAAWFGRGAVRSGSSRTATQKRRVWALPRGGGWRPAVLPAGLSPPLSLDPAVSAFPPASPWALPRETHPDLEAPAGEECAVCLHQAANTCLVPCGHTHLCSYCAWRVFGDTAKCPMCRWEIQAVVPARGPPALRTEEGL
uniref:RING-type domain-containing protein n=1 Tax=Myotis lucifugus TaxID=59463 RepID=G1Q2V8_MYOLU